MSASDAAVPPAAAAARRGRRRKGASLTWLLLAAVWLASAAYVGPRIDQGWHPLDEGTLTHAAERTLHGELSHRDFDDAYTGGLARFDAVVFRVAGTSLLSLRLALFAAFLLWVPVVYYIASRVAGPVASAAATLLAVVWSLPTSHSAMPSWYNLFLATFGTAALLRFVETRHRRWLVAAGLAGGLSIAVKIVGIYFVAAALLFLAFDEHGTATAARPAGPAPKWAYPSLIAGAAALLVVALLYLVRPLPGASPLVFFVLPGAMLASSLAAIEWREPSADPAPVRLARLAGLSIPFAAGLALPLLWCAYPYAASGSVHALLHGVLVAPGQRFRFAMVPPPSFRTLPAAAAWLLLLVPHRAPGAGSRPPGAADRAIVLAFSTILGALVLLSVHGGRVYVGIWLAIYYVIPCAVVAGCLLVLRRGPAALPDRRREQLWLLLAVAALCSLIQIPQAGWGYVLYFAPLAVLALLGIVTARGSAAGPRVAVVAAFFLVFGVAAVNPGRIALWTGAELPRAARPTVRLAIPRTGLRVSGADAEGYARVVGLLRAHSEPGAYVYAAPDCPELYFLAQRRNPTRAVFDFLDDTAGHDARVLRAIDSLSVEAVAINTSPDFSPPVDAALEAALRSRFPDSAAVYGFVVRWRPRGAPCAGCVSGPR